MNSIKIDRLAQRIGERRAGKGIREAAKEVGVSPATLSRVENGKIPDLETFSKICQWIGEDPAIYLGITPKPSTSAPTARVHFKKGSAIKKDSAKALGELILAAQQALLEEELEG
ncbi:MAG TPA: helix-turn-helix transcriptional regulator [Spongiibacteraceae bacterium]|nr:helix-turn-helix transcriptional regulator [Spongiibacteraceae bacterium]